jgi:iron-sulfur cluster repair protein YtfE (RIC family)
MEFVKSRYAIERKLRAELLKAPMRMLHADHARLVSHLDAAQKALARCCHQPVATWKPRDHQLIRAWTELVFSVLLPHMEAEDQVIFPYLQKEIPSLIKPLVTLQREHRAIRHRLQKLKKAYDPLERNVPGKGARQFCCHSLEIVGLFRRHIKKEINLTNRLLCPRPH